jgi:maltooligosyltrehalose trehalohydrolase
MEIGAIYRGRGKCRFTVWAPFSEDVALNVIGPEGKTIRGDCDSRGYWTFEAEDIFPGASYFFRLNHAVQRPDPASHFQPQGVHGPSEIVDHAYPWCDAGWSGLPLEEMIVYELHVGTFTDKGSFDSVIPRLGDLHDLGVTALEIMPVGQFPGERNWGYDGAYPFAVQSSYGGPQGLKRLVDACHRQGLAVILDVVYNHLGPEGNYMREFAPYFTDKYRTPWGNALNFDDSWSDEVRNFFIENALYWFRNYHIDALRLDAVHAIHDMSARPFLQELSERVADFSARERKFYLIAESDQNDVRIVNPLEKGGYGIDAQWCDDLHHALHATLTGEQSGYYQDFGKLEDLEKALREGFVYSGEYSRYRKRHHGSSSLGVPGCKFLVFSQNHDQVGNRSQGDRLTRLVSFEALKLAAGAVILSPYIPLLFMGEEYAEEAPYLYFVSHTDPELVRATIEGRRLEFGASRSPPNPEDPNTFLQSKISWQNRQDGRHRVMLEFYRRLIRLRKETSALRHLWKDCLEVFTRGSLIFLRRWHGTGVVLCIMNFSEILADFSFDLGEREMRKVIDSADTCWMGPGPSMPGQIKQTENFQIKPQSFVLYEEV